MVADRRAGLGFAGLIVANVISLTGNVFTLIALPLYVLDTTGSAAITGLAGFFAALPIIIGGAFGGVLVDRIGAHRAAIWADLLGGATILVIPVLHWTAGVPLWAVLALVFVSGVLDSPGQAARTAMLPEVAAAAGIPLERAVSMLSAASRASRLLGAPVAGLLVAALGSLPVLLIDAGSFVLSAGLIALLVPSLTARSEGGSFRSDLVEGLAFTVRQPLLRALAILVLLTNFIDAAMGMVLLPSYASSTLGGAGAYGLLVGVMGGGALAGALFYGAVGYRLPRRAAFVSFFVLAGPPPLLVLAFGPSLPLLAVVIGLAGVAAGGLNPMMSLILLERVPGRLRARVNGAVNAVCWAAVPLGSLLGGLAVQHFSLSGVALVAGCCYLLVTLGPLVGGPWRQMERPARSQSTVLSGGRPAQLR